MGTVYAKELHSQEDIGHPPHEGFSKKRHGDHKDTSHSSGEPDVSQSKQSVLTKPFQLQGIKARVDKIHVDGLMRTKDDIIKAQVAELFKAHDYQDVFIGVHKVRGRLEALGCFKNIGVYIDTSKGPDATPEGVEVTFIVHELKRFHGSCSTMVGNNNGSVIIGAHAPNVFGRGEKLQMEYSHGFKGLSNINISAIKPFVGSWLNTVATGSIFTTSHDCPWSGYKQSDAGLLLDAAFNPDGTGTLKHNFQYEATCREVISSKQASFRVREQSGPSLKSSLRHIFSLDKRDETVFPSSGSLIQFSTEVAGLGGDIGFVKNELIMQSNWTPHECFTFQLGVQSGLLRSISNDMKINLVDHFFLGGPMNIRGFSMRGCGPHHEGSAIGGDMYWALALHLYTPLPFRPGHKGFGDLFRLHGFVNGGNLSNFTFNFANNYRENMKVFTDNVRCTIGGGIAMKLGNFARVELNITKPLLFDKNDVLHQFQFGIGLQYL